MTATNKPRWDRDEVLARTDLRALIEEISGPGRQQGGRMLFRCPMPGHDDNNPSCDVSTTNGREWGNCRSRCGAFDAIGLIQAVHGCDFPAALEHLAERFGVRAIVGTPDRRRPSARAPLPAPIRPEPKPLAQVPTKPPKPEGEILRGAEANGILERYCDDRCWPFDVIERWGLQAVRRPGGAIYVRHVAQAPKRGVLWWQDRRVSSDGPKWLAPTGALVLPFGIGTITDRTSDVFLAEGAPDAISTDVAARSMSDRIQVLGMPGGASSEGWFARLDAGLPDARWWTIFDPDAGGDALRQRASQGMRHHRLCHLQLDQTRDVAQLLADEGAEAVWARLVGAVVDAITDGQAR